MCPGKEKMLKNFMHTLREQHKVPDSFQAYLVTSADFTPEEEYPILKADMIPSTAPSELLPFSKAINSTRNLQSTTIHFFSPDDTAERIRRCPRRYVEFFKRTAGIIGFDFSVHSDMPIVKQKAQMNDNLSLTYFFADNGIPIDPNLRCGVSELLPEFLRAIPSHSIIAISPHGFNKEFREKCEWHVFLDIILKELEPPKVLVHGTLSKQILQDFHGSTEFVFYKPWRRPQKEVSP